MRKCILLSSILIFYIMPPLPCVSKEKQPHVYNSEGNLPTISGHKMRCSSKEEKSGEGENNEILFGEKKTLVETYRLQYTQLLETHRCYLNVLLFTLSLYLAVMSACFTVVCKNIQEMKKKDNSKESSKTLLFILLFFAVAASGLFMMGLYFGEMDAVERTTQINEVAKKDEMRIEPMKVKLLENLFHWLMLGPIMIISLWFAVLLRARMEYAAKRSLVVEKLSFLIGGIWIVGYIILSLLIPFGLLRWITIVSAIIAGMWFLGWFIEGVILCRQLEAP